MNSKKMNATNAAGTRNFTYNDKFDLTKESINGIYNKEINYSYSNTGLKGRMEGFNVNSTAIASYTYDEYGRMASINGVNYAYAATGGMLSSISRPNNVNTVWSYENNRNLLSSITNNLHNSADNSDSVISSYGYTNDSLGRRTAMNRSGSVFGANADVLSYSYNDRSEVTGAVSNLLNNYSYGFAFDSIGNRTASVFNGVNTTYTSNALNQYTAVDSDAPTYDANGNMLTNGDWSYTWNGENRLTKAENSVSGVSIEADYDYMGRRIFKKVYNGSTLTKHTRFVYNGYKLIEELDALNSNAVLKRYTWSEVGFDAPVSVYDAADNAAYYYQIDGNKNVTELTDASGAVVAHYEYSPFGAVVTATGTYAEDNPFRFSSEYYDPESSLVYYNYRYYSPTLGRWLKPDPIDEQGGWNLYAMVRNNPILNFDALGFDRVTNIENQISELMSGPEEYFRKYPSDGTPMESSGSLNYGSITVQREFERLKDELTNANDNRPCCNGVKYNPDTSCCRKSNNREYGPYSKDEIFTGYTYYCRRSRFYYFPVSGDMFLQHCWITDGTISLGAYPRKNGDGVYADKGGVREESLEYIKTQGSMLTFERKIMLSPCDYDINSFKSCMRRKMIVNPSFPWSLFNNCRDWVLGIISECKKTSRGR